jgi:hypothetical protein
MAPSAAAEATYPPDLTAAESNQLVATIKDWSIAHGLAVRPPPSVVSAEADPNGILATTAPVTLFPSPFPRVCFEQAKAIQRAYNQLYASIAQDEAFLQGIVEEWVCFSLCLIFVLCLYGKFASGHMTQLFAVTKMG